MSHAVAVMPAPVSTSSALTAAERETMELLEGVVAEGQHTFLAVGRALTEIRDRRLYRERFGTFEEYVRDRWNFSRRHAYHLIAAVQVAHDEEAAGRPAPTSERSARRLLESRRTARLALPGLPTPPVEGQPGPWSTRIDRIEGVLEKLARLHIGHPKESLLDGHLAHYLDTLNSVPR